MDNYGLVRPQKFAIAIKNFSIFLKKQTKNNKKNNNKKKKTKTKQQQTKTTTTTKTNKTKLTQNKKVAIYRLSRSSLLKKKQKLIRSESLIPI